VKTLLTLTILLLLLGCTATDNQTEKNLSDAKLMEKAQQLAEKFIIIKAGGLNASFMSIYIPARFQKTGGARQWADTLIEMVYSFSKKWPDKFSMAFSSEEIAQQSKEGKISLLLGIENGAAIEDKLENLKYFFDLGVRYITLTHSKANLICDSSYDSTRQWNGLSNYGKEVVVEMNRLGIMVDVSHVSDSAFYQIMKVTNAPVIASHSSCRHFTPGWERNMSDDMIKELAESDGVIAINFGSSFLKSEYYDKAIQIEKQIKKYLKEQKLDSGDEHAKAYSKKTVDENVLGNVSDIVAHINHVTSLVGVNHVALGSDFDGVTFLPAGMEDVSGYPNLIYELLKEGYSEEDIKKICSGNFLRVMSDVEKIAQHLQSI
jgi:membrane dipeptidase